MRVLCTAYDAVSHLYQMVPLAWGLRAAGAEVAMATAPRFAASVARTGLPAIPVGHDADPGAAWRGFDVTAELNGRGLAQERTRRTMRMFTDAAEAIVDDIVRLARQWRADLVVFEPREYAGPVAAQVLGLPSARVLYGLDHTYAVREAEWPLLASLWERYGLGQVDAAGTVTVDPCPAAMQVAHAPGVLDMRPVPYNGAAVVPDWLRRAPERARVCVTFGVSFGDRAGIASPVGQWLIELAELGVEVVAAVSAAQRELLGDLPAGVRVVESIALHLVLPTCALVVHHGGAGTTLTAAGCGTPQLIVPVKGDQHQNAERVVVTGAGWAVPYSTLRPGLIKEKASDILDDAGMSAAAGRLRAESLGRASIAEVVAALEALAA